MTVTLREAWLSMGWGGQGRGSRNVGWELWIKA